jgi:hypothetical protein
MLKYVGDGAYLLQVPARDLQEEEIANMEAKFGWKNLRKTLLDGGLYVEEEEEEETKPLPKKKKEE